MSVLVLGYRKGICLALERLGVEYVLWHPKAIKSKRKAIKVITCDFPRSSVQLTNNLPKNFQVTHIIAGTEDSVFPASLARKWLNARRNSLSLAMKCTDKLKMKSYLKEKGVPMTPFLSTQTYVTPEQVIERLGPKLIAKPRKSSGGRGLQLITEKSKIDEVLNDKTILEKVIVGSEGSVESFVQNREIKFTNITHYQKIGACNLIPCHYSNEVKNEILNLNQSVISALEIEWGMTHLEFYITKQGILFGEIALRPPGGYIMDTIEHVYSQNFWELFVKIELDLEIPNFPESKNYGASYVIYPETGVISEILGQEKIQALESLIKLKVKASPGQIVKKRAGVGEDFGYAIFSHKNKQQLKKDLKTFQTHFQIKTKPKVSDSLG